MAESAPSLNMDTSEDLTTGRRNVLKTSPSKAERVLALENIQIQISENVHTTINSEGSGGSPVDNVPNTDDERRVEMRRRIGVVEANDTAQAERRKARVLSKKFGEGMLHEMPSIFNKKLWRYNISRCVPGSRNYRGPRQSSR